MALTALEKDTITKSIGAAKQAVEQLKPVLDQVDVIYNSSGGAKATITQAGLDAVPSFSGLTKSQLDDGVFALTSTLKTAIVNTYTALAELAARG